MANPAVAPLASLPPTRSRGSSEIDPKPAAQRDRAGVSIGTSTTYPPSRVQRESSTHPHVPCERRTDPAEPTQTRSAAGSGRSERRNVHHLPTLARSARKPNLIPTFPANAGPIPRSPPKPVKRSGTGPERALERPPPKPLAPSARKSHSSPRSLRAQDRSREAHPRTHPPILAFKK